MENVDAIYQAINLCSSTWNNHLALLAVHIPIY
jgi:hypothetical protein